uniref:Bms1-type G domain-containing protein n=1 Tax=Kalanchoe fedtschenkoi TaxID=63787 RepID=A0A7N0V6G7_KALFE
MAGPRAQANKAHKTRFASKSSRNLHKTSAADKGRIGKKNTLAKDAKAARIQRGKAKMDQNRTALLKLKRDSIGSRAPHITVLFGLSTDVDLTSLEKDLWSLLSANGSQSCYPTIASSEYKQRMTVLKAPHGDLLSCIEMAKVADLMCFVASASSGCDNTTPLVDSFGAQCLSVFRSLGLPTTAVLIRDLPSEPRKRNEAKKACISSLTSEFPEDCKYFPADTKEALHKFMWMLKEQTLKIPHWRTNRPYLMGEKIDMVADDYNAGKCTLLLTGYLHVHGLSVNQLVHISGAGDFQLSKIELLKDPCPLIVKKTQDIMDADSTHGLEVIRSLVPDELKQVPLLVESIPDPLAGEQTWPTEAEMADADQKQKKMKKKILPQGTSEYQAAWIVDESDVEDSEDDNEMNEGMLLDEDESLDNQDLEDDEGTVADSMMMDDEILTREQLQEEIQRIKEAHAEDEEFPDEVDTPLDVLASKRFAKYRALKSARSSKWDPKESLPQEYARIFAFKNFHRTQKHVFAKAQKQDNEDDVAAVNSYVRLHVKDVPVSLATKLCLNAKRMPVIACGLLLHESKMSVLHFTIKKHDSYSDPIKAKEQMVFHVGFRQFLARPIFSSDNIGSDKHKMERFLHPGRFSVASVYAPLSFPSLPLIAFKDAEGSTSPVVAAVGSLKSIDPDRIVLKRIILTGYPQRVSKLKCSVRYMFHNPEDVRYFKKVELWTKRGRRGRIKEAVGTHGTMKCILNGVLQQSDTVCMSLYKRAYPKWPERLFPLQDA